MEKSANLGLQRMRKTMAPRYWNIRQIVVRLGRNSQEGYERALEEVRGHYHAL